MAEATRLCVVCGEPHGKSSPKAMYCSQQCRDWRRHHGDEPIPKRGRRCHLCQASIDHLRLEVRYCSLRCQQRDKNGTPNHPDERACEYCGSPFVVGHGAQRFCSGTCRGRAFWRTWSAANGDVIRAYRRAYNLRTGAGTAATHRYQARKRAAASESFRNVEIFERDGWVCQICGDAVDRGLRFPDLFSASLDHIAPVSRGGPHTRQNVQLAHLLCNISKGDGEVERAVATYRARRTADTRVVGPRLDF